MRGNQVAMYVGSLLFAALFRTALALPHEVEATPRMTDALTLALFVKSSVGDAHFVVVPSSAKVTPTSVGAEQVLQPSRHHVLGDEAAAYGSFPVRAGERSAHVINGLACGEAYDVYFVIEAAQSNGLFSQVGRVIGVSTNGVAPAIWSLNASAVDARTDAAQLSVTMEATGVACRVWYTVQKLRDVQHLEAETVTPEGIVNGARGDSVIDFPKGLKGQSSALLIEDLDSNSWYQISAVAERAEGIFSAPVYAMVQINREPPRILEATAQPVTGSVQSLALLVMLDCSSSPASETCSFLRYSISETQSPGSPKAAKGRQVAQGKVAVRDRRATAHVVPGLAPGMTYDVAMIVETPGSNGVLGPTFETSATTFPRAPRLVSLKAWRSDTDSSMVTVNFELSEPGLIHVNLAERVGHPLVMQTTVVGNQHGLNFSCEVGFASHGSGYAEGEDTRHTLKGTQELHGIAPGSAYDLTARTESRQSMYPSGVYGERTSELIHAVPPLVVKMRASSPDATTTELVLDYEVRGPAGRLHYVLVELSTEPTKGGKPAQPTFKSSAESIVSAVRGESGVVVVGSSAILPRNGGDSDGSLALSKPITFRNLTPGGRYWVYLCTEGNSGSLSEVIALEAELHPEAPLISSMLAEPANSTSDALLLSIGLESEGLVHYVVRKADEETVNRDNIVVKKGTLEINGTSPSPPSHGAIRTAGVGMVQSNPRGDLFVAETVDGLEPNVMYEVFIATETTNSNGVYRACDELLRATTHPVPPPILAARARAADASSTAIISTVSLEALAEVHYAVFPAAARTETIVPSDTDSHSGQILHEALGHFQGCDNATFSPDGASALNRTLGIVTSGVVPSGRVLPGNSETEGTQEIEKGESAETALPTAVGLDGVELMSAVPFTERVFAEATYEAVFRVEGLDAARAYDICVFTETPSSNGLFGQVYTLRQVTTHAPVPELALEKVPCTIDCRSLNRDPCWLKPNKCGECVSGFVGKAGHANSPCGKMSSLTEEDIYRITQREGQDLGQDGKHGLMSTEVIAGLPTAGNHFGRESHPSAVEDLDGDKSIVTGGPRHGRLLVGVPMVLGPNVTKFVYAGVPERNGAVDEAAFDAEDAASSLCAHIYGEREEPSGCSPRLAASLVSRLHDGHLHPADADRPVLQVEIDAPNGESLAFVLQHGEDAGTAAVAFCRENVMLLPDEQECVVRLVQEMDYGV